jgi:hypothetical protein
MTREQKVREWLAGLEFPVEDVPFATEEAVVVDEVVDEAKREPDVQSDDDDCDASIAE